MQAYVLYSFLSVIIVSLISLSGILALFLNSKKLSKILFVLVSLSAGALFGDAFIHLLPEAFEEARSGVWVSIAVLLGIITFFVFEKFFHWHHHHEGDEASHGHKHALGPLVLISDGVHNFIDGVVIAAGFMLSPEAGIATTIAVVLHEIPQEIGDFAVLIHAGFSRGKALLFNFVSACTAIAGVALGLTLGQSIENLVPYIGAFAAGTFIYIAGTDLVPELHKELGWKKSLIQFGGMLVGIVIMLALLLLE